MDHAVLAEAIDHVRRSGEEVTPYRVHQALRQLGDTDTSYQQVFDALQAEASARTEEEAGHGGSSAPEDIPLAAADDDTQGAAEQALLQAEARVRALEAQRPSLEAAIEPARETVLQAVMRQLAAKECRWRGYWPTEDEAVVQALDAEVHTLALTYRELCQRFEALPGQLDQAHAAVRVAQQQVWLAQEHPQLVAALASVQAEEPTDSQDAGASYRARSLWRQRVASVRAQMAQVLQEANV
jgi:chromosome segregation ATPase